ncbi:hypothetical protein KAR91_57345 [Candidatus Pacearchaeota archaeon]|nr:hypothetical protein [Candidatus Pacearchaeota archaeon]
MIDIKIAQVFSDDPDFVAFPKGTANVIKIRDVQTRIHCDEHDYVLIDSTHGYLLYAVDSKENTDGVVELRLHKIEAVSW